MGFSDYLKKFKETGVEFVVSQAVDMLRKDPVKGADKFLSVAEKLSLENADVFHKLRVAVKTDETTQQYLKRLSEYDPYVVKKLVMDFVVNVNLVGWGKARTLAKEEGLPSLYTILISPTMRCNLRCLGCYAYLYSKKDDMPIELVDDIIRQGKELGVYLYTILGGEPFVRFDELKDAIYRKHNDAVFQVFTNGTLIDERVADELVKLGNVLPVISVEGFEDITDMRRGKGTFKKLSHAMDLLKERGMPFGVSVVHASYNSEFLRNYEFWDWVLEKGAIFGWVFLYMPVGKDPVTKYMPSPEQRFEMGRFIRKLRTTRPLFIMDFWNDAPYVGGCIAGARRYIHINHKGDVEPCVFAHFATDNIKEKPLKEILMSPFFTAIRSHQPFDENLLLPCMIIDNPHYLRTFVTETNAKPTHDGAEVIITDLAEELDRYSEEVHKYGQKYWEEDFRWKIEEMEREKKEKGNQ